MKQKLALLLYITPLLHASDTQPSKRFITASGFINGKAFWDTRQVVGTADDQTVFFPEPQLCSPTGDINAKSHAQILPFETRLRLTVQEPDETRALQCTGIIEVEFRGVANFVNIFNMRHAFAQMDWNNSTFIFGQTWHPLNVEELIPNTVSFNAGRPFAVYNRSPQLRYTYHGPSIDFIFYAGSQVDFKSDGPIGLSSTYIRNAIIPNLDFQIKYFLKNHVMGTGIDYQRIAPRIVSNKGYKVHEMLSSLAGIWYLGLNWEKLLIKNTLMFGGNLTNYGMMGGYAVKRGTTNPLTGKRDYTNIRTLSGWSDVTIFPLQYIETGFFFGVEKNFGSKDNISPIEIDSFGNAERTIYGLGNFIDTVIRISPRIRININQLTFAGEIEYTRAAYGTLTSHGTVKNLKPVANTQLLFSTYLFF